MNTNKFTVLLLVLIIFFNATKIFASEPGIVKLHDDQLKVKINQTLEEILANPQALNSYSYTVNNPVKFIDSNGEWFDTLIDVGFILYDVGRITHQFLTQGRVEKSEWTALGLDVGSAALPGVVGLGTISRVAKGAEKAVGAVKAADKAQEVAREADKVKDASKALSNAAKDVKSVPQKAYDTLKYIKEHNFNPREGYKGGGLFQNNKNILPKRPDGYYKKWDIDKKIKGVDRNQERIITDKNGKAWYTDDHYNIFTPMQ